MVHVLKNIHRLLQPGDYLLDIRPYQKHSIAEVHDGDTIHVAGEVSRRDNWEKQGWADDALSEVVGEGLFVEEASEVYGCRLYAPSYTELEAYIAEEWQRSRLDDEVVERIKELMAAGSESATIAIQYFTVIKRLRRI